ncbi:hypothetical protein LFM09_19855 [Lentzea alba]
MDRAFDGSTKNAVERRLRNLVYPYLGDRKIGSILPTHIRVWLRTLQQRKLAGGTRAVTFIHVSAIFNAAVDDKKIAENPCKAKSVTKPQPDKRKIVPWSAGKVAAVRLALSAKYKIVVPLGAAADFVKGRSSVCPLWTLTGTRRCSTSFVRSGWWTTCTSSRLRSAAKSGTCRCLTVSSGTWTTT